MIKVVVSMLLFSLVCSDSLKSTTLTTTHYPTGHVDFFLWYSSNPAAHDTPLSKNKTKYHFYAGRYTFETPEIHQMQHDSLQCDIKQINKLALKQKLLIIAALKTCRDTHAFSAQTESYIREISEIVGATPLVIPYYPIEWYKLHELIITHDEPSDDNLPAYTTVTWQIAGKHGFTLQV